MKDERVKMAKDDLMFQIDEVKAGYIAGWQLFWAMLVAPFKVAMEFATGQGRWAVHHTRDSCTQSESTRNGEDANE